MARWLLAVCALSNRNAGRVQACLDKIACSQAAVLFQASVHKARSMVQMSQPVRERKDAAAPLSQTRFAVNTTLALISAMSAQRDELACRHRKFLLRGASALGVVLAALLLTLVWRVVMGGVRQAEHGRAMRALAAQDRLVCERLASPKVHQACMQFVTPGIR